MYIFGSKSFGASSQRERRPDPLLLRDLRHHLLVLDDSFRSRHPIHGRYGWHARLPSRHWRTGIQGLRRHFLGDRLFVDRSDLDQYDDHRARESLEAPCRLLKVVALITDCLLCNSGLLHHRRRDMLQSSSSQDHRHRSYRLQLDRYL